MRFVTAADARTPAPSRAAAASTPSAPCPGTGSSASVPRTSPATPRWSASGEPRHNVDPVSILLKYINIMLCHYFSFAIASLCHYFEPLHNVDPVPGSRAPALPPLTVPSPWSAVTASACHPAPATRPAPSMRGVSRDSACVSIQKI